MKVIPQAFEPDDYGSTPSEFLTPTEFPTSYFIHANYHSSDIWFDLDEFKDIVISGLHGIKSLGEIKDQLILSYIRKDLHENEYDYDNYEFGTYSIFENPSDHQTYMILFHDPSVQDIRYQLMAHIGPLPCNTVYSDDLFVSNDTIEPITIKYCQDHIFEAYI